MNGASQKSMYVRRDGGTHHVGNGDIVIFKVFKGGVRTRRGMRAGIATTDMRVLQNHLSRLWRRNGMRLGRRG